MKNKLKIKGWKSEQKIDSWLNRVHKKEIHCSTQGEYLLCESKTYIQALKKENKKLKNELYESNGNLGFKIDEKNFWKHECVVAENQNKEMLKQHQDYFDENEKLKQENDKLKKENEKYIKQLNVVVAGLAKISHCSNEIETRKECDMCLCTIERIK